MRKQARSFVEVAAVTVGLTFEAFEGEVHEHSLPEDFIFYRDLTRLTTGEDEDSFRW